VLGLSGVLSHTAVYYQTLREAVIPRGTSIKRHSACIVLKSGCYSINAAPGSGVCREARRGACGWYVEENSIDSGRHEAQDNGARDSTERVERVREATCADSTGNCEASACNVQIGDKLYCSQCRTGFVPINGKCAAASSSQDKCTNAAGTGDANTICEKCIGATFMFKGGCYDSTVPPGNVICSEVGSTAGQCETCADGYFRNSNASPTSDSCLECDPTCLTCSAAGESGCKSCKDGYFLGATINTAGKCIKCDNVDDTNWKGVVGCLKCTTSGAANTPATCTECQADRYLKAKVGDTAETCETKETCTGGYFPKDESTGGNKCVQCSSVSDGGIADCSECSLLPSASRSSATLITCPALLIVRLPLQNEQSEQFQCC
ncbi:Variant-specific surface protein, partial [Giardia duodenalis]